jgi:hypothetical protein
LVIAHIAMEAVLESCDQELDPAEVQQWFEDYFRKLHGIEFDQPKPLFDRLAQSRRITRGTMTIADGHVATALKPMIDHTVKYPRKHRRAVRWADCFSTSPLAGSQ